MIYKIKTICIALVIVFGFSISGLADLSVVGRSGSTKPFDLVGSDDRQQLVVIHTPDGSSSEMVNKKDVTGRSIYTSNPAGVVESESGYIKPIKDGKTIITVEYEGETDNIEIVVSSMGTPIPINFTNEINPILTKLGCSSGGCHGKSGGQNGFRLSLLGYEPWNDYQYIVNESRGRRVFTPAPENSLLITKATADIPHGGGSRLEPGSYDYNFLVKWISMGVPYGSSDDPVVMDIEVFPKHTVSQFGETQQLSVTAKYSDGTSRDVTRAVKYESNHEEMSSITNTGLVIFNNIPGSTSVMVRFQNSVSVFIADIPLGVEVVSPTPKNYIDTHIFKKFELLGLPPSELSDDSSFLRRSSIDIMGRIPTKEEIVSLLKDTSPDKRASAIDRMLDSEEYAENFASKWAVLLRNKRDVPEDIRTTFAFYSWLKSNMRDNAPFDEFVGNIITASGTFTQTPQVAWYRSVEDPKEQMQDISQVFLGIRMECAQCHHHPFDKWSQDDYYGMTAFFSTLTKKSENVVEEEIIFHKRAKASSINPNTKESILPTPLGGSALEIDEISDPRVFLSDWIKDPDNPLLSRMLVNRYWSHFFGRGIVEPEDDMRLTNPATHPELLDELSTKFIASGFDMKELIRTITNSHTYQLSSEPNSYNLADVQNYSRYYPNRLRSEVLLDSVNVVGNIPSNYRNVATNTRAVALPDDQYTRDVYFLNVFGRATMDSACSCNSGSVGSTLAQSLHLLNSSDIQNKLAAASATPALLSKLDISNTDKVSELYLKSFSRYPTDDELSVGVKYLEESDSKLGLEDLVWSLINSKEFMFKH